jgi:hypothetical protein
MASQYVYFSDSVYNISFYALDCQVGGEGWSGWIQWFDDLVDTRFVDNGHDLYARLAKSDLQLQVR